MKNYSNYIVQNAFNKCGSVKKVIMAKIAVDNFMALCSNKFGSNIIEVMLKSENNEVQSMLIQTLLTGEGEEDCYINRLMKDQFGNYVLKSAIQCLPQQTSDNIISHVVNYFNTYNLFNNFYSKRLINDINIFKKGKK